MASWPSFCLNSSTSATLLSVIIHFIKFLCMFTVEMLGNYRLVKRKITTLRRSMDGEIKGLF